MWQRVATDLYQVVGKVAGARLCGGGQAGYVSDRSLAGGLASEGWCVNCQQNHIDYNTVAAHAVYCHRRTVHIRRASS